LKVLFACSEATPFIKTGGLADVCGSLPIALSKLGVDVRLVLPGYPSIIEQFPEAVETSKLDLLGVDDPVSILKVIYHQGPITLYIVNSPQMFDRQGNPYIDESGNDWPDNALRFGLFSRVVTCLALGFGTPDWRADIVHCHDWQTGLVPALLSLQTDSPPSLFTIHNLAYQGNFPKSEFAALELPEQLWTPDGIEFYDKISFMKAGLVFANKINTVSNNYCAEICTAEYGFGFEGLLRKRVNDLSGIVNGVDYDTWNPATDKLISKPYSETNFSINKPENKRFLQQLVGLPEDPGLPVIGMVGRLVIQKGIDLLIESLPELMTQNLQLIILGVGEKRFHESLLEAKKIYHNKLAVLFEYSEKHAHAIQAGSDMFIMPSRFEPCGLSQIYSLRYGTIPIVRKTGGLADTVFNTTEKRLNDKTATGFVFKQPTPESLIKTVNRALAAYKQPSLWKKLMHTTMTQIFSWETSAKKYRQLYSAIIENK